MKKAITILLLLLSTILYSQRIVVIEGDTLQLEKYDILFYDHVIRIEDSVVNSTLNEVIYNFDINRVDFHSTIKSIDSIVFVEKDKNFIAKIEGGSLILNSYSHKFPYTKRIIVMHLIGKKLGAKVKKGSSYHVMNENFILNNETEDVYKRRRIRKTDLGYLVQEAELASPLNTKIGKE